MESYASSIKANWWPSGDDGIIRAGGAYRGGRDDDARLAAAGAEDDRARDAWALLAPIVRLDETERRGIAAGGAFVEVLDAPEPSHLLLFAASRIDVTPQQFVVRIRNSPRL